MKSYTTLRNLYGTFTKNTSSANLTLGDQLIMDEYRAICDLKDFTWLHRLRTTSTVASTQFVNYPYDVDLIESVYVTITGSTMRYTPKFLHSREQWDMLNRNTYSSDYPMFAFAYNGQIGLWPIPATTNNTIYINCKVKVVDLNTADISSTTITTLTQGSTALTVSAGLTTQMAGFFIRPTFSTTANTGDGQWYEISSVTNATTATLVRAYGGASISAGTAACTIAQMPLLPDTYHVLPVYKAAATYWYKELDQQRGDAFQGRYEKMVATLLAMRSSPVTDFVLDDAEGRDIINPNLTIQI